MSLSGSKPNPTCTCQPQTAQQKGRGVRGHRSHCPTCHKALYCDRHGSNYADTVCGPEPCAASETTTTVADLCREVQVAVCMSESCGVCVACHRVKSKQAEIERIIEAFHPGTMNEALKADLLAAIRDRGADDE